MTIKNYEKLIYQPIARQAHVSGEVKLRLLFKGGKYDHVSYIAGAPMLVLSTWKSIQSLEFICNDCTSQDSFEQELIIVYRLFNEKKVDRELDRRCRDSLSNQRGSRKRRDDSYESKVKLVGPMTIEIVAPECVSIN